VDGSSGRSVAEVFEDHLQCRLAGDVEGDLARNYHDGVVILSATGVYRGKVGVRAYARLLQMHLGGATLHYLTRLAVGEVAFLEWTANGPAASVEDGVDSFVIRNGLIVAQTIHYTPLTAR
jgi:hypothetical protein